MTLRTSPEREFTFIKFLLYTKYSTYTAEYVPKASNNCVLFTTMCVRLFHFGRVKKWEHILRGHYSIFITTFWDGTLLFPFYIQCSFHLGLKLCPFSCVQYNSISCLSAWRSEKFWVWAPTKGRWTHQSWAIERASRMWSQTPLRDWTATVECGICHWCDWTHSEGFMSGS